MKRPDAEPRPSFPASAPGALSDLQLRRNLRKATSTIRAKRAAVAAELPDWEALREAGRAIKAEVMAGLDGYLEQLEAALTRAGGQVHRARDADQANRIIGDLVEAALDGDPAASDLVGDGPGLRRQVVKVKSITTDEVGLNEALTSRGITAVETDLAELIIQLAEEESSHFLVPAIHKNRTQIRDLFRQHLGRPDLSDEPAELAEAARVHLRRRFLEAEVAVSGANFAIAETGTLGVVESEGNGRMCLTLPRVLITLMGIEKVLPRFQDLEVFLQLLPRSATGERMNPYTSLWTGVTPGDGPEEVHLVLLDNGRRRVLADPVGRQALHCIRCSACLNSCPVYARVGGHAYHATYPGPIGSILTPQLLGPGVHDSLPFASTLCGACAEVCPVRIDIPRVLLYLRGQVAEGVQRAGPGGGRQERWLMRMLGWGLRHRRVYAVGMRAARLLQARLAGAPGAEPGRVADGSGRVGAGATGRTEGGDENGNGWLSSLPGYGAGWTLGRDVPPLARESFREWWARERSEGSRAGKDPGKISTAKRIRGVGEGADVASRYRVRGERSRAEILSLFVERVEDYGAMVHRCTETELAALIGRIGSERGGGSPLVAPLGLPEAWTKEVEVVRDGQPDPLSREMLDGCAGVVTGCALAVAETGTIVLDGGPVQGRRALSLVPDYHLCVVGAEQIVETVPEAVRRLERRVREAGLPVTLISGPSATSDIELSRVEGVHGPRTLEVIVVGGSG